MMKFIVALFLVAVLAGSTVGDMTCSIGIPEISKEWIDLKGDCLSEMRSQIQMEFDASYAYLAMAAHFSKDTINRPGFAEFFFHSAKEEREHGSKLIEYLSMRGELLNTTSLFRVPTVEKHIWNDGAEALADALDLEIKVTKSIRKLIHTCEKGHDSTVKKSNSKGYNYFHLVDWLVGTYLEEQLKGQREIAGKLVTLKKLLAKHAGLGEFLFDKEM